MIKDLIITPGSKVEFSGDLPSPLIASSEYTVTRLKRPQYWNENESYAISDVVFYEGSSYQSLVATNVDNPQNADSWTQVLTIQFADATGFPVELTTTGTAFTMTKINIIAERGNYLYELETLVTTQAPGLPRGHWDSSIVYVADDLVRESAGEYYLRKNASPEDSEDQSDDLPSSTPDLWEKAEWVPLETYFEKGLVQRVGNIDRESLRSSAISRGITPEIYDLLLNELVGARSLISAISFILEFRGTINGMISLGRLMNLSVKVERTNPEELIRAEFGTGSEVGTLDVGRMTDFSQLLDLPNNQVKGTWVSSGSYLQGDCVYIGDKIYQALVNVTNSDHPSTSGEWKSMWEFNEISGEDNSVYSVNVEGFEGEIEDEELQRIAAEVTTQILNFELPAFISLKESLLNFLTVANHYLKNSQISVSHLYEEVDTAPYNIECRVEILGPGVSHSATDDCEIKVNGANESGSTVIVDIDEVFTLEALPSAGFTFENWKVGTILTPIINTYQPQPINIGNQGVVENAGVDIDLSTSSSLTDCEIYRGHVRLIAVIKPL